MRREILTLKEACEYMNCSRSTIYKYMENEPDFPAFQEAPGCKLYFVDAALKAVIYCKCLGEYEVTNMLTEIEQKVLYKVLKEEPFSELETELMNRMLYLDEEIRHEVDKRNEVEEQLADLFKETRKNMKEVKK